MNKKKVTGIGGIETTNTLVSKGEMFQNGEAWEKDLELTYTRLK